MTLWLGLFLACQSPKGDQARPPDAWWKGESGWCGEPLTAEHVDEAIRLGRDHMVANQLPAGNFVYEYDWRTERPSEDDNEVRQAGAFWGLALVHLEHPDDTSRAALQRALGFWHGLEVRHDDGRRWLRYPRARTGHLGTLSLVALAHIDLLRSRDPAFDHEALQEALNGYIAQIVSLREPSGLFSSRFDRISGTPDGLPSPYSDGEALLALGRAAHHLGRDDLWPLVEELAEAGHAQNVVKALQADPDSDTTKGYYQWASMSWYEIVEAGRQGAELWSERLMDLAVWMVDVHQTLLRSRNTAYAYEGIVPAFAVAHARQDPRADKFGCVIQLGLRNLTSWQIGHPLANPFVAEAPAEDPRARGGVQNRHDESLLRIDVVQHQTHAQLLARRLWVEPPPATAPIIAAP